MTLLTELMLLTELSLLTVDAVDRVVAVDRVDAVDRVVLVDCVAYSRDMKTLTGRIAPRCDKHQFCDKMTVST